jgi:Domain of unknown function (DUF397)
MEDGGNSGGIEFRKSTFSGTHPNGCVEVATVDNGARLVRDSKHRGGAVLQFTPAEWDTFLKGVRAGEFG